MLIEKQCEQCGAIYRDTPAHARKRRFCSRKCMHPPLSERLRIKTDRVDDGDVCWLWNGRTDHYGYGRLTSAGKECVAHRLVWEDTYGPIPEGLCVLHRCDNPPCVNPAHLFLGTRDDNNKDRAAKGRSAKLGPTRGEAHHRAKMTAEIVATARNEYEAGRATVGELAERYGVGNSTMSVALSRKTWKDVA